MESKGAGTSRSSTPPLDPEEGKPKIYFTINSYEDVPISIHNSYTIYPLKIETSYKQWIVKHRYSEFLDLHKYLLK